MGQNNGSEQLQVLRQPVFLSTEVREIPTTVASGILRTQLREYFPALSVQHSWIRSPFVTHNEDAVAGSKEQDSLVQLSCDTALKLILEIQPDLCLKLTSIQPDIHKLTATMQQHHPSHLTGDSSVC